MNSTNKINKEIIELYQTVKQLRLIRVARGTKTNFRIISSIFIAGNL